MRLVMGMYGLTDQRRSWAILEPWHKRKDAVKIITAPFLRFAFRILLLPGVDRIHLQGFDLRVQAGGK